MNNEQIRNFFEKKEIEETPCYLTEELVNGGFKQKSGGYIGYAKERNIVNPTQYWHLIEGWCNQKKIMLYLIKEYNAEN